MQLFCDLVIITALLAIIIQLFDHDLDIITTLFDFLYYLTSLFDLVPDLNPSQKSLHNMATANTVER